MRYSPFEVAKQFVDSYGAACWDKDDEVMVWREDGGHQQVKRKDYESWAKGGAE